MIINNGYLTKPYETNDLARGIDWVLGDNHRHSSLSTQSRERALKLWSDDVVAKQYLAVYEKAIDDA